MDRQSLERLRFDRRLKTRDGWLDATKEGEYLASLPDVAEKMTTCAAEEDAAEAAAEEASTQRQPELEPQTPAPVAGDFSTQGTYTSPPTPDSTSAVPSDTASSDSDASEAIGLPDQGSAGTFRSEGGFGGDSNSN